MTLTAPANGSTFTAPASVTLSATASDPDGTLARVEFYNGTTLLGTDTTSPYSVHLVVGGGGDVHREGGRLRHGGASAIFGDGDDHRQGAANKPPTVTLTAPASGATFTAPASVTLSATASDPEGKSRKVEFYNGTTLLGTDTTSPYSSPGSSVAAGTYTAEGRRLRQRPERAQSSATAPSR